MPAIGFSYIFIFGKRKKGGQTFGQKIWWNHLRPIHALLYALFAYLAINKNKNYILFYFLMFLLVLYHFYTIITV